LASCCPPFSTHREKPFNPRQRRALEVALSANDSDEAWLTARRIVKLTKAAPATATRDLAQLEEWNVIRKDPESGGRSTRYFVILTAPHSPRLIGDLEW
jgi:Fic family protein